MKWCKLFQCWCSDEKEVIDSTKVEICDYECNSCDDCEEVELND